MSKIKILIVEDEQIIAMALEESLISLGYDVIGKASSGEEAIELTRNNCPDLILMDIMLGDGYDGIQTARILDRNSSIPVIFLTALSDESTLQSIKEVNPFGYLIKPCDDRELVAAIEVACARQRKELAIAAALEKEQALREMKAKFMSMLSHEFANALNIISMAHQMLVSINERSQDLEVGSLHQTLGAGIDQMHRLIQDASTIAQEEFYGFRFAPEPCDLVHFCSSLADDLSIQYSKSHKINLFIDESIRELQEQAVIFLDQNLLYHTLTNIISNGVKYSPLRDSTKDSKVELEPEPNQGISASLLFNSIEFRVFHENERVVFQIQDYGIGIPPETLHNLFQPFNRGSNVGKIPGTGLGLPLVKQCVELHRGEIKVESELNRGTTFTLLLPYGVPLVE